MAHSNKIVAAIADYIWAVRKLPRLYEAYLDHSKLAVDNDWRNLIQSLPVTLRALTREIAEIRGELDGLRAIVLAQARGNVRVLVGPVHRAGYITVCERAGPGIDLVAPPDHLPFRRGEIDEIFLVGALAEPPVAYWASLLRSGGMLHIAIAEGSPGAAPLRALFAEVGLVEVAMVARGGETVLRGVAP